MKSPTYPFLDFFCLICINNCLANYYSFWNINITFTETNSNPKRYIFNKSPKDYMSNA